MTARTRNTDLDALGREPFALAPVTDADFDWLLGNGAAVRAGLTIAPGGVDDDVAVIRHVRDVVRRLTLQHETGTWMMVAGGEVVGLIGFHRAPSTAGDVEIGYNVAPSRRCRGHATAAVAAIVEHARADGRIRTIVATTAPENLASQRALERNGFRATARSDAGADIVWKRRV